MVSQGFHFHLILFFLFLLGLSVGSFLNVVIDRLPRGEHIWGRSYCDHCQSQLAMSDLIPLLSFFLLKGGCRFCHKKISWQYPIVELITGLLFAFVGYTNNTLYLYSSSLVYLIIIVSGLIVIFFTDLKYRIIPDQIILILAATSLVYLSFFQPQLLISHLLSAILLSFFFLLLVILTRGRGMGFGDVKFSFLMGLILGFPKIIIAFYLSFLTGALFSLILILARKKTFKSAIAFGPFLVGGTFISLFYGKELWEVFKRIIGI